MQSIEDTGERWFESEAYRLKARLLAVADPKRQDDALALLHSGITVAEAQSAAIWRLRATSDAASLLRDGGDSAAARALLQPILARFASVDHAPDVIKARRLIASLS